MTDWRTPLSAALLVAALAVPAAAQPAASPDDAAAPPPAAAAPVEAPPRSPAEEAVQRAARLDALFTRLADKDDPAWQSTQTEIWRLWSQSGSAAMDLLLSRAEAAMEQHEFARALRFLDDLVRLAPDFAEGWNKRATVYFLMEDYGRSVADIQRVLALEPHHFGAISGLGIILERLGNKEGAMRAFRRGLEVHPNLPGAAEGVERLAPDVDGRSL